MKSCFLIFVIVFLSIDLFSQQRDSATQSLIDAELSFAKLASEKGISPSFFEYFADSGLVFRPVPTNAKEFHKGKPGRDNLLAWYPIYAEVSKAGDLGITTGPWEFFGKKTDSIAVAFGYFNTVWQKQNDGNWKVLIDLGTENSKPAIKDIAVKTGKPEISSKEYLNDLSENDRKFSENYDPSKFSSLLISNARFYRNSYFPKTSADSIQAFVSQREIEMEWKPTHSGISKSNDLGYTYGSFINKTNKENKDGYYVKVWKRNSEGKWKILLDILLENEKK